MSAISTTSAQVAAMRALSAHGPSPKQRLLDTIAAQTATGAIGAEDQTALDGAVDAIDRSLTDGSEASGSSRLDPSGMKSRIDDLIGAQVANGSLTSSQAETLKGILAQGPGGGGGREGGPDGIGGAGGPPPGAAPSGEAETGSGSDTSGTTGAAAESDAASALLARFIAQLQDVQSGLGGYSASGQTGGRTASALLVNFEA